MFIYEDEAIPDNSFVLSDQASLLFQPLYS